uniref:Uncharacterized protein n=1 Tax=Lygus hesperus TaxID=30085 RepID=A0A0K8SCG7_LYGHE
MDCSNPIKDTNVKTVAALRAEKVLMSKQSMATLREMAVGKARFRGTSWNPRQAPRSSIAEDWRQLVAHVSREVATESKIDEDRVAQYLDKVADAVPICALVNDKGDPLRVQGECQQKGSVRVTRKFGGAGVDKTLLNWAVEFEELDTLKEAVGNTQYTNGTAEGFLNRMKFLFTRKTKSVKFDPVLNKELGDKYALHYIKKLMPIHKDRLKPLTGDLYEIIDQVRVTATSSAGPGLWGLIGDRMEHIIDALLIVSDHIRSGKLEELRKAQPELFLTEVKNKLDRYDTSLTGDKAKTRPYVAQCAAIRMLFSIVSQNFCGALKLFHEDPNCANAYGFSAANGGLEKVREVTREMEPGTLRAWHYGDDTDLYHRDRNGTLFRCCPDFKQMDGSVDSDTIRLTVKYMIDSIFEEHPGTGEKAFWEAVGALWCEFAIDPDYLINGTSVWRKKSEHRNGGLNSGVVNTTGFDTVKSMVSYYHYIQSVGADPSLLEERKAIAYFKRLGLDIKEGTWTWERVLEDGEDGDLWTNQKFLGVLYKYSRGPETTELVPYLEYEDWLKNLLITRVSPDAKRADVEKEGRRRFDALRGTYVTGAFSNPRMASMLDSMLQKVPAEHILMAVQAGGGKGETPENDMLLGKDFEYPDSFSWPTVKWCQNLYFSEKNRWKEAKWEPVFPELVEDVAELRSRRKEFKINTLGAAGVKTPFGNTSTVVSLPEPEEPELAPRDVPMEGKYARSAVRTGPILVRDAEGRECGKMKTNLEIIKGALVSSVHPLVYPRARDFELINEGRFDEVSVNGQVFIELVAHPEYGLQGSETPEEWGARVCKDTNFRLHPVVPVAKLVSATGLQEERLIKYAKEYGFIVIGKPPAAYVSAVRVEIPGFSPAPPPDTKKISKATPVAVEAKKFEKEYGVPVAHDVFESPITDPHLNDIKTKAPRGSLHSLQELLAHNKVTLAMEKDEDLYSFYIQSNESTGPNKAYAIKRRFIGSIRADAPRIARTKASQAIFAFLDAPQIDESPVKPPSTWGEQDEVDSDLAVREYVWRDRVLFRQEGNGPLKIVDDRFVKGWKETEEGNLQKIGYDLVLPRKQPQVVFKMISKLYKNLECTIQHAPTNQPLSQISKKAAAKWKKERSQSRSSCGSESKHGSAGSRKQSQAPSKKDGDARGGRNSSYRSGSPRSRNGGDSRQSPSTRRNDNAGRSKSPVIQWVPTGKSGKALCAVEACKAVVGVRPGLCSDCTRRFGLAPQSGHGPEAPKRGRRN